MVLEELLKEEKLSYLKNLNHNADLSRIVMTVESTETPDVEKYIPQHTFLLMTGMAFQDNQQEMCEFLETLNEHDCAGVAIKLGRFINELDMCVIDMANRLRLPLFQIPIDITLGEVYHEILSRIWNNQNNNYLNALNTQRKISNLVVQGSSLKNIANNLTVILQKQIMIVDMFGEIQAYGYTFEKSEREKCIQLVTKLMMEGRLDNNYYYDQYDNKSYCVYSIKGIGRTTNFLIVQDFNPQEKTELIMTMEQVLMALGLYFYKNLYIQYNQMKTLEEFFSILLEQLSEKIWTEKQILSLGESYGLKLAKEYQIVFITLENKKKKFNSNSFSQNEESYILLYEWMKKWLDKDCLIFPQESNWRYILVIQGKKGSLKETYAKMFQCIKERFKKKITIAQGGIVSSVLNMKNSYLEAEDCLEHGKCSEEEYLLSYKAQNILELFRVVPERERKEMCKNTLKELAFPENPVQEELRKTLHIFLFSGGSITKTAETMFLHRNTIKYRIKKCEEIVGIQLSNATDCFYLQLALVLSEKESFC